MSATGHHPFQLGFQRSQLPYLRLHRGEMGAGDHIGLLAGHVGMIGQVQKRPKGIHLEAEIAGVADEGQTPLVVDTVETATALRPGRLWQKTRLLVKPDGWDLYPGAPGKFSDGDHERPQLFCLLL